ncbi:MAG: TetR/AcrR family transcriptional regulator [Nocardiopsaceae bacterium]|nr:TetR/AcrR family transcriptional regulator [Nocardiopsaceae bacterium]
MANPSPSRRTRRRAESPHRHGDQRETAILASLEKLLEISPLASVSIDDIAKGAGISRPTLYFYFASRSQVFESLLARTLSELSGPAQDLLADPDQHPDEFVDEILRHVLESWRQHGTVLRRAVEASDDPAINRLWQQTMAAHISALATWIRRGRERGIFLDTGEDPAELAEALAWMVERGYYQLFREEHSPAEEERKVVVFSAVFQRACGYPGPGSLAAGHGTATDPHTEADR